MRFIPIIFVFSFFISCATAGVSDEVTNSQPTISASTTFSGISLFKEAYLDVYDFSDPINPQHLATLSTDVTGAFSFELTSPPKIILLVTSGGHYTDPLLLKSFPADNELITIFKKENLAPEISFMTDLFASLTNCLSEQSGYGADSYLLAQSIFMDLFEVDPLEAHDSVLWENTDDSSSDDVLWTDFNLAFFKMAKDHDAASGLDVLKIFSNSLNDSCSMLITNGQKSKNYVFEPESFRGDYLDALTFLPLEPNLGDVTGDADLEDIAEQLRNVKHFMFGMEAYEEN